MRKNKKSILIITERFHPEDFGINDLALAWQKEGYDVGVLAQAPSYPFDKIYQGYKNKIFQTENWRGITIYRVISLMGYKKNVFLKVMNYLCYACFSSILSLFIGRLYDNIFVYHVGPLTQAAPAILIKKIYKKNVFIWTLDIWPDSVFAYGFRKKYLLVKGLNAFVKLAYDACDSVFVSCEGFIEKIRNLSPDKKIFFSPQWVPGNMDFTNTISHESINKGYNFTFAGNIGKVQNLENVIRGFNEALKDCPGINLNIVGDGSNLNKLKLVVKNEEIENVFFWGRRPLEEMPKWFEGSDALIISLDDEPIFSLTVPAKFQAYLASAKPIYCIMNGEVAKLVDCYKLGYVAQPNSIPQIKQGFINFTQTSEEKLTDFGNNMKILLDRDYKREKIIKKMTTIIFDHKTKYKSS